jgi:hypothetical protein
MKYSTKVLYVIVIDIQLIKEMNGQLIVAE